MFVYLVTNNPPLVLPSSNTFPRRGGLISTLLHDDHLAMAASRLKVAYLDMVRGVVFMRGSGPHLTPSGPHLTLSLFFAPLGRLIRGWGLPG